jgi:hypothetical protein
MLPGAGRLEDDRVRCRVTSAAVLTALALAVSACGKPPGIDGDLVNGWKAMPDPTIPTPPVGACYNLDTDDPASVTKWPAPVDCTAEHTVETIFVGSFTGADAERDAPPSSGSPGRRAAYEKCAAEAKTYLGEDWRSGRLSLAVVLPIGLHWQSAARWYRCDMMEYTNFYDDQVVRRTASLKGSLTADRPVGLSCLNVKLTANNTKIEKMTPTACDAAHNAEFAGVFDLPDGPYPTDAEAAKKARLDGCGAVVATYTAVPQDANLQSRIGWISSPFSQVDWDLGNRGVRCYAHSSETLNKSIKGAGPSVLPVD